jgi:hypothetical protein
VSEKRQWIQEEGTKPGRKLNDVVAVGGLTVLLVGIVLVFADPSRMGVRKPPLTPSPTFSTNDSGTPLPTEAEAWGRIWSQAKGVAVLRPTWLPKSKDEYQIDPMVRTAPDGSLGYSFWYIALRSAPGTAVWTVEFFADSVETQGGGFIHFGGVPETVTIRRHAAELTGNGSPGWVLVWTEGSYRYAIQAFAVSRDDLLRIADSLAQVVNDAGNTH